MPRCKSPCPDPRANDCSSLASRLESKANASPACPRISEPCGVRMGAKSMTGAYSPRSSSAVVDRLRRLHRWPRGKIFVPARYPGMARAPVIFGKSKIEIRQRAPDRDVADRERRIREVGGFPLERSQHRRALGVVGRQMHLRRMDTFAFVAQQQQKIEKSVAERLPAQRRHAVLA